MQGYSNFKPLLPPYWIYAVAIGHLIFEFQLRHHLQLTYWLPMATYACPLGAHWKCVWNDNTALQQGVVAVARQARLSWLLIADARLLKFQATTASILYICSGYRPFNIWISAWASSTAYLLVAYDNLCLSIVCTLEMCLEWRNCTKARSSSSSSQTGKVKLTTLKYLINQYTCLTIAMLSSLLWQQLRDQHCNS